MVLPAASNTVTLVSMCGSSMRPGLRDLHAEDVEDPVPSLDGALGHRTKRTDQLGVPIRATESERPHELLWLDRLQGRDGRPWPFTRRRLGRVPAEQPAPPRPQGRRAPVRPPPHFATWLEDAGIPSRVIDELMGRRRSDRARVSPMGALYREITPGRPISTHAVGARRSLDRG